MHGDNGRVIENPGSLRFTDETLLKLFGLVVVAVGHAPNGLECDQTADERILRQIHHAHGSLAEFANDLVTTELHRSLSKGRPIGRQ